MPADRILIRRERTQGRHPAGDLTRNVLLRESDTGQHLRTRSMVVERLGTPTSRHGTSTSDARNAAETAEPIPPRTRCLRCHNQLMATCQRFDGIRHRNHPARIDHRHANALIAQPLRNSESHPRERTDRDKQNIVGEPPTGRAGHRRPRSVPQPEYLDPLRLWETNRRRPVIDLQRFTQLLAQTPRIAPPPPLMPGTMLSIDKSHIPLWLAPSLPVIPARSSTIVTGRRCSATSIMI